jgi:alternate signal-mediated exported protein
MKNMTKGAIVTGLGVALLLGGGGTLAVWNAEQTSTAGTVASGNLDMVASAGTWSSNISGPIASIATYKIVPGEKLTYTQPLAVTLEGNNLSANVQVTGSSANNAGNPFTDANITVGTPVLSNAAGKVLSTTKLTGSQTVTASTTFEFKSTTTGRDSVNAKYDFSGIGYRIDQIAPTPAP